MGRGEFFTLGVESNSFSKFFVIFREYPLLFFFLVVWYVFIYFICFFYLMILLIKALVKIFLAEILTAFFIVFKFFYGKCLFIICFSFWLTIVFGLILSYIFCKLREYKKLRTRTIFLWISLSILFYFLWHLFS